MKAFGVKERKGNEADRPSMPARLPSKAVLVPGHVSGGESHTESGVAKIGEKRKSNLIL